MLQKITRYFPTLMLAFALSIAVWILAITSEDPAEVRAYPYPVNIEIIGQEPTFLLTNEPAKTLTLNLRAPRSIWTNLLSDHTSVRAIVDLSGMSAGPHTIPVQIQIVQRPVEIVSFSPSNVDVTLEPLLNRSLPITLTVRGDPAVGFRADTPVLNKTNVTISGPESTVKRVQEVRAILDQSLAHEDIEQTVNLLAMDNNELPVNGITMNPDRVQVKEKIIQRGGYRNVVVKVDTTGNLADGYRLTNITAYPPSVTVFSADPKTVDNLPGYVETAPINLTGMKDDRDIRISLNLPPGVSIVGDQTVNVQVGVSTIESSVTLNGMRVEVIGGGQGLDAKVSPESVDVIISGPIPLLDNLKTSDVRVYVDMTDDPEGTYQRTPQVEIKIPELRLQSIIPGSIEIILTGKISSLMSPLEKGPA
jgi:YbbR domain-containing protein